MATVTHLFKTFFPNTQGGIEEAIRQIGKYSLNNGYDVNVVYVSKFPQKGEVDGIRYESFLHSIGSNSVPFSVDLLSNFKRIVENTDILHLHFPWPTGELMTILFAINKPIVITFHCDINNFKFIRALYSPFINILFKKAKVIVATSNNLVNSTPVLKKYRHKTQIINLWLDESRFLGLKEVEEEFKQKINKFGNFCLFVGVLRWYKGLKILLKAAEKINGNIVIVGKGPMYKELEKDIKDKKINNVFLLGYQSDEHVNYLIKQSKFVVLPSISPAEAFGQILLEASYNGKPMITTELGTGTSFVNLDNKTGFVIPPSDHKRLTDKCNILFEEDSLQEFFGENAYKRYLEKFSPSVQGPKYMKIYNEILKK